MLPPPSYRLVQIQLETPSLNIHRHKYIAHERLRCKENIFWTSLLIFSFAIHLLFFVLVFVALMGNNKRSINFWGELT